MIRLHPPPSDGKVLYRTTAGGEWLESDADITGRIFNGFAEKSDAVEVYIPSLDASRYEVREIGIGALSNCIKLEAVTIPNSVHDINISAFSGCSSLSSVSIGSGVVLIENGAFSGCSSLSGITIPASVGIIKDSAFKNCSSLLSVYFDGFAPVAYDGTFEGVADGATAYVYQDQGFSDAGDTWYNLIVAYRDGASNAGASSDPVVVVNPDSHDEYDEIEQQIAVTRLPTRSYAVYANDDGKVIMMQAETDDPSQAAHDDSATSSYAVYTNQSESNPKVIFQQVEEQK